MSPPRTIRARAGNDRGPAADRATTYTTTCEPSVQHQADSAPHPRRWTAHEVAELVEVAITMTAHRARVAPVDLIEHEVQPWPVRVGRLARALERIGAVA